MSVLTSRPGRYVAVGLATLAVYMGVGRWTHGSAMSDFWQAGVPFAVAVAVNYMLQRSWVFAETSPLSGSLPKYTLMVVIGCAINYLALTWLTPRIPLPLAQLTAVSLVVIWNALLSFCWVFAARNTLSR